VREDLSQPQQTSVATLTIVYDHHTRGLSDKLNNVQHDHGHEIVSSLHVHLDHHNCLEVIVLRGKKAQIQALGDRIAGFKGVKHATLALTTDGKGLR
jgi:CopG family nickel-responsive transcriptional regulator